MKKIILLFLTICVCLSLCILLNGCGEDAHEHSYGEWVEVKKATCSERGLKEKLCECGEKITEEIELLPHTEEIISGSSATCKEIGLTEGKKCSVCNAVLKKQEEIKELGHSYNSEWLNDETHHWHQCVNTGCQEISEKIEHKWDEGTVTKEATAKEEGEMTYLCECGKTKVEVITSDSFGEEDWKQMIEMLKSDNYTLDINQTNRMSYEATEYIFDVTSNIKLTKDKALYNQVYNQNEGENIVDQLYTGEELEIFKENNLSLLMDFISNFDNYVYDEDENIFLNNGDIVINFDNLYGYKQTFVIKNAKIVIDEEGNLYKFESYYTQTVNYSESVSDTFHMDITWIFTDYGKTVIE